MPLKPGHGFKESDSVGNPENDILDFNGNLIDVIRQAESLRLSRGSLKIQHFVSSFISLRSILPWALMGRLSWNSICFGAL